MKDFEFYTPTRMIFGREKEKQLGQIVASYGFRKVMIHFGGKSARQTGLLERLERTLQDEGIDYVDWTLGWLWEAAVSLILPNALRQELLIPKSIPGCI